MMYFIQRSSLGSRRPEVVGNVRRKRDIDDIDTFLRGPSGLVYGLPPYEEEDPWCLLGVSVSSRSD